jgi:uncharacterized membrane protein YcaP (DUF421 family)
MKKEEIHLGDINRWFFGQARPEFMIEVFIRTILIYLFLLLIVRVMGKRLSGQLTLTEMSIFITLGAIVSPVMQLPDRRLLFGVIGLLCAFIFQRGLTLWGFKNENVEHVTQGKMSMLIKDGIIDLEELSKTRVTRQQLFSMLREKKIQNLGKVKRAYLEACGIFSVFQTDEDKPGLPLYPHTDPGILHLQHEYNSSFKACCSCGHLQKVPNESTTCEVCNSNEWSRAYTAN